jgi:hypothetical protein
MTALGMKRLRAGALCRITPVGAIVVCARSVGVTGLARDALVEIDLIAKR